MGTTSDRRAAWVAALRRAAVPVTLVWGGCLVIIVVATVQRHWAYVAAAGVVLLNGVWVFSVIVHTGRPEHLVDRPEDVAAPDPSSRWAVPPPSRRALRWQLIAVVALVVLVMGETVALALLRAWSSLAMVAVLMVVNFRWLPRWLTRWQDRWRAAAH